MKKYYRCIAVTMLLAFVLSGCSLTGIIKETVPGIYSLFETDSQDASLPADAHAPPQQGFPAVGEGDVGDEVEDKAGDVADGENEVEVDGEDDGEDEVATPGEGAGLAEEPAGGFRGVWVATVLNLDFPSKQGLSAESLKREIDAIVSRTAELGLNAIIFQVRPTGDSFYKSDVFPWSQWLSGAQGSGVPDFDPLEYWIEACHANDIELHAWLNPFRIIHTSSNSSDPDTLAPSHPVRLRPELAVEWMTSGGNAGLFLDPGLPEARKLIIDGIGEIITKYDVDGIHIDDYFYPGANFRDDASYARYGNGMDLADWRRENVNEVIKGIQSVVRKLNVEMNKNVRWGVSPTAIWMNGSNDPRGVPTTRGQESYKALYADTRRWVTEGWIDYICPQIYWYIGYDIANFEPVLNLNIPALWEVELCRWAGSDRRLEILHCHVVCKGQAVPEEYYPKDTASHTRILEYSKTQLWDPQTPYFAFL